MHKWYMKLFRRLLRVIVLKCMIIYRKNTGKSMHQLAVTASFVKRHL